MKEKESKKGKDKMARKKLAEETKKMTLNMGAKDFDEMTLVAKLQEKTISAFVRDVVMIAVDMEINQREIYVFDAILNMIIKPKLDINYFKIEFDDFVDYNMRESLGAICQGFISIDVEADTTGMNSDSDNAYLYQAIKKSTDQKVRFWTKQELYTSEKLAEDAEAYANRDKETTAEKNLKEEIRANSLNYIKRRSRRKRREDKGGSDE